MSYACKLSSQNGISDGGIHKIMPRDLLKIYNVVSTPGRREFYPHYHSDLEIAYFRTGRGVYSVTGREYPIGEGDIFTFRTMRYIR